MEGIRIVKTEKESPTGVPEPEEGVYYIVSKMVAERLAEDGRVDDILVPDELVRDEGRVLGCRSLSRQY